MTATVEQVFERPHDLALRAVVADALQQQQQPWGELIALQLATPTPTIRKRIRVLLTKPAAFVGPIAHVASLLVKKKCLVFENGFLSEIELDRRLVPRPAWTAAAKAQHWATVRNVALSVLTTPQWWIEEWAKNPASTRSLLRLDVSNALILERATPTEPWTLVRMTPRNPYGSILAAFIGEAKIELAASLPKRHCEFALAALDLANRRTRS
jgi:uncharacterized protein (TIGR02996 family)